MGEDAAGTYSGQTAAIARVLKTQKTAGFHDSTNHCTHCKRETTGMAVNQVLAQPVFLEAISGKN
jgi:hypothetical protein